MREKTRKILAIDPGTREIGVAVLAGSDLEFYGVKTVTKRSSPSAVLGQVRQIVRSLIRLHEPDTLAIERPFVGYGNRSTLLVVVSREIKQMVRKRGLNVVDVNPKTAKKSVTGSGSATKRDVARVLCSQYPELRIYLGQTHKYKDKYWQNMFDAVAVGLCASATD